MNMLGFSRLINVPGKSDFDELTEHEVALMIEAFLNDGNAEFDPLAFNDFLHADLRNDELKAIQRELNQHAFVSSGGDSWPAINRSYLEWMSAKLKSTSG